MTDDQKLEAIIIELVRYKLLDASDGLHRIQPDDRAVRQAILYAKSRPNYYANLMRTAIRIVTALERLEADNKQKDLDLELDRQTTIDRIWDAVEEFSKQ
jgi:hypothetical protein